VNPLADRRAVRRPTALRPGDEAEVEILNPVEVNRLLDAVDPHDLPLYLVAVSTGMRLGELPGLQWGDMDHTRQQIRVQRTLYRGEYYLPKSRTSRRSIDVGDQVLGTLKGLERERHGAGGAAAEAPVFTTPDGAIIDPDNLRNRVWAPALKKAELRRVTMHSLRHTFASLLIAQGESVKYVQRQLGHASATLTLDTYSHLFPAEKRTSAMRLEAQLAAGRAPAAASPSNDGLTEPAGTSGNTTDEHGEPEGSNSLSGRTIQD
jgi:integrase